MKKMLMVLLAAAALLAGNAAAVESVAGGSSAPTVHAQSQAVGVDAALTSVDMQAAFQQDAQPMQVATLTGQEMQETQGAWFWVAFRVVWFVASVTYGIPPAY